MHGDLDCYEGVARALANHARCSVLAVDYRLAPEHPFPAGFDDVWAAVEWSAENFGQVGVAGDSSGGNLAAAAALKARDRQIDIAVQVLVYPVLESHMNTHSKRAFRTRYAGFLNQPEFGTVTFDRISYIWDTYVPEPHLRDCPYVSPLRAEQPAGRRPGGDHHGGARHLALGGAGIRAAAAHARMSGSRTTITRARYTDSSRCVASCRTHRTR